MNHPKTSGSDPFDVVTADRSISENVDMAWQGGAQDALNRMARAHARKTGCHLTAEMIASLALTLIGEIWAQDDPRL